MDILYIDVPNLHDSFSRVVLSGTQYLIRFTYNDTMDSWSFGLFTLMKEPILEGVRIVPEFPLNLGLIDERLPKGMFWCYSSLDRVGRQDFVEGKARFSYNTKKV